MRYSQTLFHTLSAGLLFLASPCIAANENALEYAVAPTIKTHAHLQCPNPVQVSSDNYGKMIALSSVPGQPVKNLSTSCELAVDYPHVEGETLRYSWRIKIPKDFEADPANRWWLLSRWNDQPNVNIGQREEDFLAHNPSIMIAYKFDGQDTLSLSYGMPEAVSAGSFSIPRDEWIKLTMEIKWSRGSDGSAKLYINNAKAAFREMGGKNMYGKYQTLFRIGNYRSSEIQTKSDILIGDVSVERISGS